MATLVVAVTLLVCALLPKALRDATVLLQYRTAQLQESNPMMNSSRQMTQTDDGLFHTSPETITTGTCPQDHGVAVASECEPMAAQLGLVFRKFRVMAPNNVKNPAGCFLFNQRLFFNPNMASPVEADGGGRARSIICGQPTASRRSTGTCPEGLFLDRADCHNAAYFLGLVSTPVWGKAPVSNFKAKHMRNPWWPKGCFQRGTKVWYNSNPASTGECSDTVPCICSAPLASEPGPPAYIKTSGTKCPVQVAEGSCRASADGLGLEYSAYKSLTLTTADPPGCYLSNGKLYYNSLTTSTRGCSQQNQCICSGAYPQAYMVMRETCKRNDRLEVGECRRRAEELHFRPTAFEMEHESAGFPNGCFLIGNKLYFNSAPSAEECTADKVCICASNPESEIR